LEVWVVRSNPAGVLNAYREQLAVGLGPHSVDVAEAAGADFALHVERLKHFQEDDELPVHVEPQKHVVEGSSLTPSSTCTGGSTCNRSSTMY
jgi:hypothetical protein